MAELVKFQKSSFICRNLIGGAWSTPATSPTAEVCSPYTGAVIGQVPLSSKSEVDKAVTAAAAAFPAWRETPIKERSSCLFRFRELVLAKLDALSNSAAAEAGKTVAEARAGILKGVEVTEYALSLQNLDQGGAMEVSRGVTCQYRREPLGVVAGITPFNFPAMVPMWMFPIAVTLGNCFILKPSEKVPVTACLLGELMVEAGFPAGVFSVIHGSKEAAQALTVHPQVKALAFVGSTAVAKNLYAAATNEGKRALCLGGAKNYLMVVPDAEEKVTVEGVVSSFTGCAGQRCMAASLMVGVGPVDELIAKIARAASTIELGPGMGAIIDPAAKERISKAIDRAQEQGAKIILDGRKAVPPKGHEGGNWLGPTIIDYAKPEMDCAKIEIFGPVLTILRTQSLDQALALEATNPYGNATSIFTTNGAVARYVSERATSGMVGVNVGVPVPREPFSFGGFKASKFGQGDITGDGVLDFWTDRKKITTKWAAQPDANWMS